MKFIMSFDRSDLIEAGYFAPYPNEEDPKFDTLLKEYNKQFKDTKLFKLWGKIGPKMVEYPDRVEYSEDTDYLHFIFD